MCQAFTRHYRTYYLQNSPLRIAITPILHVRKLRLAEMKELVQGHKAEVHATGTGCSNPCSQQQ